jgi:hybrid cluster-associated redox disulfide protein
MKTKINKDSLIDNVIKKEPNLAEDFFKMGMMCIGCPMSQAETIEQGCMAHGFSEKQTQKFVEKLNKKLEKKKTKKKTTRSKK